MTQPPSEKYKKFIVVVSVFVCILGIVVAMSWIANITSLSSVIQDFEAMKFNTSVGFLLLGLSLFFETKCYHKPWIGVSRILSAAVLFLGVITLSQDLLKYNAGIDQLLIPDFDAIAVNHPNPGRMSPITSLSFSLLGLVLIGIHFKKFKLTLQWITHVVAFLAFIVIVGYLFRVPTFYNLSFITSMAVHTAIAFLLVAVATSLINPSLGITGLFTGNNIGNIMARKLFLQITLVILLLGFAGILAHHYALVSEEFGIALRAVSFIIVSLLLLWRTALELNTIALKKEAAEDNLSRIELFLDSTPDPVVIVDERGCIQLTNKQTETVLGYQKKELIGKSIEKLMPARFREKHEHHREVFTLFKAREMGSGLELLALTKSGEEISVEITLSPIETKHGIWVSAALRDITLRKESEKKIKEYQYFFTISHDFICVLNARGYVEIFNPNFEKVLGYSAEEFTSRSLLDFVHPDDINTTIKEIEKLQNGIANVNFVNRCRKKDGHYLWLEWNITPDRVSGKHYAIARNISERKESEERQKAYAILESRGKEMEQFAFITSHDLREPLLTMKNYISILIEDYGERLDEGAKRYTQSISKAAQRMDLLISSLLDYSRLGNAHELQEVNCDKLIKDILEDLNLLITSNQAIFVTSGLPTLRAYPVQLKLLFQNLINNAIKFRRKDVAPEISISAKKIDRGWQFEVTDNGIGIEEKDREKIFNIFQRLHKRDAYEGTGIGLAHCKRIAELHNGHIWVKSSGYSSSFYFTILTEGYEKKTV